MILKKILLPIKTYLMLLAFWITLCGCATQPENTINLTSDIQGINKTQIAPVSLTINTADLRTANYIVKYDADDAAQLLSPTSSPRVIVNEMIKNGFIERGVTINSDGKVRLQIVLEDLLTSVKQNMFSYQADTQIKMQVNLTKGELHLAKTFTTEGSMSGPFKVTQTELQNELNKLIAEACLSIVNDPQISKFIS